LNTSITIGKTEQKIDKQTIEDFSNSLFEYSLSNYEGRPRGLRSGVASVGIYKETILTTKQKGFAKNCLRNIGD